MECRQHQHQHKHQHKHKDKHKYHRQNEQHHATIITSKPPEAEGNERES